MFTDASAVVGILVGDLAGGLEKLGDLGLQPSNFADGGELAVNRPGQVGGGGPGGDQLGGCGGQDLLDGVSGGGQGGAVHAVTGGGANQPSPAHMHLLDGFGEVGNVVEILDDQLVGEMALVDDLDDLGMIRVGPDGPVVFLGDFHRLIKELRED